MVAVVIKLQSTGSSHFYTKKRNKAAKATGKADKGKVQGAKLELKKYDPVLKKHVVYREEKIK